MSDPCAVVAADEGSLWLGRGPYGGRALYFASTASGDVLVACSRLAPLLAAIDRVPTFELECLAAVVSGTSTVDPSLTPYAGVSRVLPCETVRVTPGGIRRTMCVPTFPEVRPRDADSAAAEMRERLFAVAARAAHRFSRVAVLAGGGVDSSGLLATLVTQSRQSGGPAVEAIAMDFGGKGDDRPHMAALARHLDIQPLKIRPAEAAAALPELMIVDAAPNAWPGTALVMLAGAQARERGNEAILTGVGGDDVLDGDVWNLAERAIRGDALGAFVDCIRLRTPWRSSPWMRVNRYLMRRLVWKALPNSVRRAWRRRPKARPKAWDWAGPRIRKILMNPQENETAGRQDPWSALAVSVDMLDVADVRGQCEVAANLPRLDPYLEGDFIRFVVSLPPELLFYGHRIRGLYRHATVGLLPDSLRLREDKASFEPAIDELLPAIENQPWFRELLRMEALGDLGLVEPRPFRDAFARVRAGGGEGGWLEAWPALAVEAFVRSSGHGIRSSTEANTHG